MRVTYEPQKLVDMCSIAEGLQPAVEAEYEVLAKIDWEEASLWRKFLAQFQLPSSFVFFHKGEHVKGENYERLRELSRVWHSINWIVNSLPKRITKHTKTVSLDRYDARDVARIIKFMETR